MGVWGLENLDGIGPDLELGVLGFGGFSVGTYDLIRLLG